MAEHSKIILIPRLPDDMALDILTRIGGGFIVQACAGEIGKLKAKGIAVAELYSSGNEFAGALFNQTKEAAVQILESKKTTAVAAMEPDDKKQFEIA